MKPWVLYIITVISITLVSIPMFGMYGAGEITFYSLMFGGIILTSYYALKNRKGKVKFHSTKVELGEGKGFIVPLKDSINTTAKV